MKLYYVETIGYRGEIEQLYVLDTGYESVIEIGNGLTDILYNDMDEFKAGWSPEYFDENVIMVRVL